MGRNNGQSRSTRLAGPSFLTSSSLNYALNNTLADSSSPHVCSHQRNQHGLLAVPQAVLWPGPVGIVHERLEVALLVVGWLAVVSLMLVRDHYLQQRRVIEVVGCTRLVWS